MGQKDLDNEEFVQELIDTLALKRLQTRRLRNALSTYTYQPDKDEGCGSVASTAPSIADAELACQPATEARAQQCSCGQSVLVEFDAELSPATIQCQNLDGSFRVIYDVDGTYEDVELERISDRPLDETDAVAKTAGPPASAGLSKKAKTRARKQKRDATRASALTGSAANVQAIPGKAEASSVASHAVVQSSVDAPAQAMAADTDLSGVARQKGLQTPADPSKDPAEASQKHRASESKDFDDEPTSVPPAYQAVCPTAAVPQLAGVPLIGPFGPQPSPQSGSCGTANVGVYLQWDSHANTLNSTTPDGIKWYGPFGPQPSSQPMGRQHAPSGNQDRGTWCRFSRNCARRDCWYQHPEGRYIDERPQ